MRKDLLWLWLTRIKGIGLKRINLLLQYYGDISQITECTDEELKYLGFKGQAKKTLLEGPYEEDLKAIEYSYLEQGIGYLTLDSSQYPHVLKHLYDPPVILYYRGELKASDLDITAGIVGARRCSEYGKKVSYQLGKDLASEGVTVISGMARGIDSSAHKGAVAAGGRTIAILGCGVDICYPKENKGLMMDILKFGVIMSEIAPGVEPKPGFFPLRNRIISGLSQALIVVEAAKKSGSLITADQGLEQGKDIYAVPGNIYSKLSEGTHHLVKQGAKLVTSSQDILEDLGIIKDEKITNNQLKLQIKLEKEEKMIYDILGLEPLHSSTISTQVGLPIDKIQSLLTLMEINGHIEGIPGKGFIRK